MDNKTLYFELNKILSSSHSDNKEEMNEAITSLHNEMKAGVSPEVFIKKMKQLVATQGDYRSKLSTVILNRYWEKTYRNSIACERPEHD